MAEDTLHLLTTRLRSCAADHACCGLCSDVCMRCKILVPLDQSVGHLYQLTQAWADAFFHDFNGQYGPVTQRKFNQLATCAN